MLKNSKSFDKMFYFMLQFLMHLVGFAIGSSSLLVLIFYVGRLNSRLPH